MSRKFNHYGLVIVGLAAAIFLWWWFFGWLGGTRPALTYLASSAVSNSTSSVPVATEPLVVHLPTPTPTRALYMTQCAAASPELQKHLLKLADETEINAIVVDLKDYSGTVIFPSATAVPGGKGCTHQNFADLVKTMHERGIYVIGRLTVFQDPLYTKTYPAQAVQSISAGAPWRDRKGLSFVDVAARPFWDYIVALAREARDLGVDEINFDYIRYPSDGNMADAKYVATGASHAENLEQFFAYLKSKLDFTISADLFGMTTTNQDDLNIGQVLERTLPYFDFIDPMVYPSHYPPKFNGWPNPNARPYDIIHFSLASAIARTVATTTTVACGVCERVGTSTPAVYQKPIYQSSKIRPWLQDFDYPIPYTPEMVKAQIDATYALGLDSWLLWDPRNEYTRSVLAPTEQN